MTDMKALQGAGALRKGGAMQVVAILVILLSYGLAFIPGYVTLHYNAMLLGVLMIWLLNILAGLRDVKKNFIFVLFNLTFFTFLLARPTISLFRGTAWWHFDDENVLFALTILMLGQTALFVGRCFGLAVLKKDDALKRPAPAVYNARNIQVVALFLYAVSFAAHMLLAAEKLVFMSDHTYLEYYSSFQSSMPYAVYVLSTFLKYSLCMFLATKPKKREAFVPLAIYFASAIPELLIGMRNPIVLNSLFIFLYYCLRDFTGDDEKWLGRTEKTLIVLVVPAALLFLGAYNYIRAGQGVQPDGIFGLIVDLFYKQGVSFDVLCIAYGTFPLLPVRKFRNYTFGGFIDYFTHGQIGQLFGGTPLPAGNNLEQALYSNSFAHNMSYIAKGQEYLDGAGWGTSYLLETYVDYGYVGVVISSLLLGFLCIYAVRLVKKGKVPFYVTLLALTALFFVPRGEATGWLTFLLTMQFWVTTFLIVLTSNLCIKTYRHKNLKYEGIRDV